VCGRLLDFPVVTSGLYHAEFSWPAVERVLQAGGDFALL